MKDLKGIELPEETRITLWKEKNHYFDGLSPIGEYLEDCTYGDLRKKYTPENEILLSSNKSECLALYFKGQEQKVIEQKVIVEDIQPQFTVNLCTKRR